MKTKIMLQGIEETVTRPVQVQVAHDIKDLLGMRRDMQTFFDPNDEKIAREKNKLGDIYQNNTNLEEYLLLETEETSEEGTELYLTTVRPDTYPIYQDIEIGTYIQTINQRRQLDFRVTYYNKSKSFIFSIMNKLKLMTGDDTMIRRHELEYSYSIPQIVVELLAHFNELKNKRKDPSYHVPLKDYLRQTFDSRLNLEGTLSGDVSQYTVGIREAQIWIEGYITDAVHDLKPEFNDERQQWGISFNYRLTYEKPVGLLINYPIMIWNTPIKKELRDFQYNYNPTARANYTRSMNGIERIVRGRPEELSGTRNRDRIGFLTIPIEDETPDITTPRQFTRLFSVLTMVYTPDPTLLFNIDEIPNYKFKDSVRRLLLESEYKYIGIPGASIIFASLIEDNRESYTNRIILSQDGTLRTTHPMDYKKTYRVMFSLLSDMDYLHPDNSKRINRYINNEMDAYKHYLLERAKYKDAHKELLHNNISGSNGINGQNVKIQSANDIEGLDDPNSPNYRNPIDGSIRGGNSNAGRDVIAKDFKKTTSESGFEPTHYIPYTEDSEIFVDIYAEILNVDYGDLENSLKSAGNTRGILYKISDRHRAASKNVNIFNIQANVLVEDKKIP